MERSSARAAELSALWLGGEHFHNRCLYYITYNNKPKRNADRCPHQYVGLDPAVLPDASSPQVLIKRESEAEPLFGL